MSERAVLWANANIATCDASMREVRGALLTVGDRVEWLGEEAALPAHWRTCERKDLGGRWITPGLIDCHTHLVFAGTRAGEWNQLLNGATYEQIARSGGGIVATVNATRRASDAELFDQSAPRLESLLAEGVTTVEIKSGYGLTLADERKMLRVARQLGERYPVTVRATFLAAHAVPPEFTGRDGDYIAEVADRWLPALHAEGLVDIVDVFCERIAFDIAQSERVFEVASKLGLPIRMHAEQLSNMGATQLATRYRALSCDHLEFTTEEDAKAMARTGTVAVLLPTAFLHLNETKLPPLDALRKHEVAMAVASDCNPGSSPCASILLAAALATRLFRLRPAEALAGITRHAATACGAANRGALSVGAVADFAIWDVASIDELQYWLGRNGCVGVVRGGAQVRGSTVN